MHLFDLVDITKLEYIFQGHVLKNSQSDPGLLYQALKDGARFLQLLGSGSDEDTMLMKY